MSVPNYSIQPMFPEMGAEELPTWISGDQTLARWGHYAVSQEHLHTAIRYWNPGGYQILCRILDHENSLVVDAVNMQVQGQGVMKLLVKYVPSAEPPEARVLLASRKKRGRTLKARCLRSYLTFDNEGCKVEHHERVQPFDMSFNASSKLRENTAFTAQAVVEPHDRERSDAAAFQIVRPSTKVQMEFKTTVHGSVGNLAQGNQGPTTQTATLNLPEIRQIVGQIRSNMDDLALSKDESNGASRQLEVIDGELAKAQPSDTLIREAGRSLRAIVEGAIAGAAANPGTWVTIGEKLKHLF